MTNSTARNREWREKQAKEGRREVRGIYAPDHLHERIKRYARRLVQDTQHYPR